MSNSLESPWIVAFVADLMFASRIEAAASGLGFQVRWVERVAQLEAQLPTPELLDSGIINADHAETPASQPGAEPLSGSEALLIEQISALQPAMMIFDLGNSDVPWRQWISLLKSSPATRRIPVICYGSHVESGVLQTARASGADTALARSRFASDLPELIQKYARVPDLAAIQQACQEPLSVAALHGLELFNRGEYFEAHEALEEAWKAEPGPGRELYRAILQVGVAYLQIERGNYNGAIKMFLRLRQWLNPLPDECRGVDIARLRSDAQAVYSALTALGADHLEKFDRRLLRPVIYRSAV
jgi:predicted metal-dependent hydrolase